MEDEAEKKIDEACQWAISQGWTITRLVTVNSYTKQCCPMGALALKNKIPNDKYLNLGTGYAGFISGFDYPDAVIAEDIKPLVPYFELGRKFRQKYAS